MKPLIKHVSTRLLICGAIVAASLTVAHLLPAVEWLAGWIGGITCITALDVHSIIAKHRTKPAAPALRRGRHRDHVQD